MDSELTMQYGPAIESGESQVEVARWMGTHLVRELVRVFQWMKWGMSERRYRLLHIAAERIDQRYALPEQKDDSFWKQHRKLDALDELVEGRCTVRDVGIAWGIVGEFDPDAKLDARGDFERTVYDADDYESGPVVCQAIRDIVFCPYRTIIVNEGSGGVSTTMDALLFQSGWVTDVVRDLAVVTYEQRREDRTLDPVRLGVLADALEEEGCGEEILATLRTTHAVYRGFWPLDLVLEKK